MTKTEDTERRMSVTASEYQNLVEIAFRARTFLSYDSETNSLKELAPEFKKDLAKSVARFMKKQTHLGL